MSGRTSRLMADFTGVSQGVQAMLSTRLGVQGAADLAQDCRARFAALIPAIPDIGPGNRNQESLLEAVWLTAITQAMTAGGLAARDAGRVLYDLCAEEMNQRPAAGLRTSGQAMFTPKGRAQLAAWAKATQQRRYPGDWVGEAVFGDGKSFDVGYDYSQCGAVTFFAAHGVAQVARYFCLNDFILSRAQGTGLTRAHTLGQGDTLCDFRYKKDGPVSQDWESEERRWTAS